MVGRYQDFLIMLATFELVQEYCTTLYICFWDVILNNHGVNQLGVFNLRQMHFTIFSEIVILIHVGQPFRNVVRASDTKGDNHANRH